MIRTLLFFVLLTPTVLFSQDSTDYIKFKNGRVAYGPVKMQFSQGKAPVVFLNDSSFSLKTILEIVDKPEKYLQVTLLKRDIPTKHLVQGAPSAVQEVLLSVISTGRIELYSIVNQRGYAESTVSFMNINARGIEAANYQKVDRYFAYWKYQTPELQEIRKRSDGGFPTGVLLSLIMAPIAYNMVTQVGRNAQNSGEDANAAMAQVVFPAAVAVVLPTILIRPKKSSFKSDLIFAEVRRFNTWFAEQEKAKSEPVKGSSPQ